VICTVDAVLLALHENALVVALFQREGEPYQGVAALPGGYIHADQDVDAYAAAERVLREKTGIAVPFLEQLATFSGPARDPRGWSIAIAYYALVPYDLLEKARCPGMMLVDVDRLHTLPFDHKVIVDTAVARLRNKSQYSTLPCYLAGDIFTLPQLQRVYEALLHEPLNKVSFRRKMTELDALEAVGAETEGDAHRPAQLYRLKPQFRKQLQLLKRGL
jgi:ADP-ribose pyrophosphatase YjhB (NUDIX family)